MESAPPMLEKTTGMSFENEYKIEQENIKYIFKIGKINNKEESLILFVSQEDVMSSDVYQKSFDLKELQELNKTFRAFDTLNEVKDFLKEIIQEKGVSLIKHNGELNIVFKFKMGIKKEEEVKIKLIKSSLPQESIVEKLVSEVNELKKAVNLLIEENKEKDKKIDALIKEIKIMKEKEPLIQKIEKFLNKKNTDLEEIESNIIKKKEEINLIENRIKNNDILKNKKIKYKLIFRGTRDGTQSSHFHEKCDGIPNTFFVVQTIKGLKFGAYTENSWKNEGGYIKDSKSFLFSFDLMKIYNYNKNNNLETQYFHKEYGPSIYYSIWINKNMFKENNSNVCQQNSPYSGAIKDYELNNGESKFTIKELEVFQVILE